jgi:methylated-DNA-[protein]-cysteine S-methyltransferase
MILETTYYKSPIGVLEVRSEDDFITAILFTNSWKGKKIDEVDIDFIKPVSAIMKKCFKELDEYFSGKRRNFSINIEQHSTPFREKVWNELINIQYGNTISYLELSKRIGDTKAIRAVGTANGNNNICIVVPCHRVIGSNGDLIGYGGDLWRKKWLLEHEARIAHGLQTLFDN